MRMNDFFKKAFSDWPSKLFCILFAVCLVFLIRFSTYSKVVVDIPLKLSMPEGYVAQNKIDDTITLTISGNQKIIYLINPHLIEAVADFTTIPSETLEKAVKANAPLAISVDLQFPEGIIDISDEIIMTTDPAQIRVLLSEL